jgi:NADPH-dependent curcumin reductase CurA
MTVNRQWVLKTRPSGLIGEEHFEYREVDVPTIGEGEVLVRTLSLSFDPTQRGWVNDMESYMPPVGIGEVMRAGSVGQVIESNNHDYSIGDLVQGTGGWQDYVVVTPGGFMGANKLPQGVSPEMALGVLGVTGLTAYFGLLDLAEPKAGDTVLVSGAAGATGSVAGQIAKIKGCRVVGIAGGPEKCRWLIEEGNFDAAIDYKNEDVEAGIAATCPEGINIFFDNVGGEILEAALNHLAMSSRVILCGGIAGYNSEEPIPGPRNLMNLVITRSRMEGFIVIDYMHRMDEFIKDVGQWLQEGKIAHLEDVQEGFENIPATLQRLFTGKNMGKQLLKIAVPL